MSPDPITPTLAAAPKPGEPRSLSLPAGRGARLYVEAGSQLICTEGYVQISTAAQWFGAASLSAALDLAAGEATTLEHGGWISFRAGPRCELLLCAAAPRASRLSRLLAWLHAAPAPQARPRAVRPA
jgi:hypothetical protein